MFKTAAWFYGKKLISDNLKIEVLISLFYLSYDVLLSSLI